MDKNKLYEDLMNLTKNSESFFFKDFTLDNSVYRIFNYRLASWTEFQLPGGIEARGIMFDVTDENNAKLVCMPPSKFFNYEEGNVDHSKHQFGDKMIKMDGSLISSYLHNSMLYLKSKGSLFSEQALDAMKFLDKTENLKFKEELLTLAKEGWTVNLEYTSPENRIVIPYQTEDLTVLSARSIHTGENMFATKLKNMLIQKGMKESINHLVGYESLHDQKIDHNEFITAVRAEQEGEGYVVEVVIDDTNSYLTKLKNIKYIALHQTKDSVNSDKKLFEAVIEEATDDLRGMFFDDPYVLNKIENMEKKVRPIYNHLVKTVEDFYEKNKDLTKKDYAILVQQENRDLLGLCMGLYLGRKNDYKDFAKKRRKEMFGVEDVVTSPDDEGDVVKTPPKP